MEPLENKLFQIANTLNALKYPSGLKYGPDIMYHLHEANLHVMKAALEVSNNHKKKESSPKSL